MADYTSIFTFVVGGLVLAGIIGLVRSGIRIRDDLREQRLILTQMRSDLDAIRKNGNGHN